MLILCWILNKLFLGKYKERTYFWKDQHSSTNKRKSITDSNKWANSFRWSAFDKGRLPIQYIFHFSLYSIASCFTKPVVLQSQFPFNLCHLPMQCVFQFSFYSNAVCTLMQIVFPSWLSSIGDHLPMQLLFEYYNNTHLSKSRPDSMKQRTNKCTLSLQYILKHLLVICLFVYFMASAIFPH